jgi:heat shock protein HslJ
MVALEAELASPCGTLRGVGLTAKGAVMRLFTRVAAVTVVLGALASLAVACGSSGGGTPELDGTSWRLTGWSVSAQDPNDFTITAEFKDGQISGKAAVNSYSGTYTVGPDDAFSVGAVASTKMAGPEPDMQAESTYFKLLAEARSATVDGDTLTLNDANGNESLIFSPQ